MDVVETMKKSDEAREIKNLILDNDNDRLKELKDEMFLNDCKIISKIISCEDNYDDIIVVNIDHRDTEEDPIKWSRFIFKKEFGEMIYKLCKLSRFGANTRIYYGGNINEWFKVVQISDYYNTNSEPSTAVELRIPLFGIYADPYLETSVAFDKILEYLKHPMVKIKDPAEKK